MEYEKYVFVKPLYNNDGGVIHKGDELYIVNGTISLNGGMLPPDYQIMFRKLIEQEKNKGWEYLCPDIPIYNKC